MKMKIFIFFLMRTPFFWFSINEEFSKRLSIVNKISELC